MIRAAGIRILIRLSLIAPLRRFQENHLATRILSVILSCCLSALALEPGRDWAVRLELDARGFERQADSLKEKGFSPVSLDIRSTPEGPRYSSSWNRAKGPAWAFLPPVPGPLLRDSLAAWSARGYRPRIVSALDEGSAFAVILEKDSTAGFALTGLDRKAFQAACDSAQRNRLKCVWADAYGTVGDLRFAGVWKKNTEGTSWNYSFGDDEKSLHVKMEVFSRVWVRPSFLAPLPGGRYFTLWEENSIGPWASHADIPAAGLRGDLEKESAKGLYPICLQAIPGGEGHSVLLAETPRPLPRKWSVSGPDAPGLERFDDYMRDLMSRSGVRGGALAIAREGKLVFSHGYTWAEAGYPETKANSLFRVASCSKPLTSILVHKTLREGGADGQGPSLKEKILSLLPGNDGDDEPREPADARFRDITVDQLLTHSGGWVRSRQHPDPVFNDFPPGSEIRNRLPASRKDFLKYMLGQPLQFDPGSKSVYDNFGYFLLGRLLESLPMGIGKSYESLAGELLFHPLGLSRPRFGGSRFEDRAPDEVLYHTSVPYLQGNPDPNGAPWVPGGYGDFELKNMDAAGAWLLSAPDYAKVLAAFDLGDENPILNRQGVSTMWGPSGSNGFLRGWFGVDVPMADGKIATAKWHNGLFPGTSTLVFYRPDKWSFALFLNRDLSPQPSGGKEGVELGRLADAIKEWPASDLFPEMGIPSFVKAVPSPADGKAEHPTATAGGWSPAPMP
jgi:CubicO group peptidase (beta-lactamase class C family)